MTTYSDIGVKLYRHKATRDLYPCVMVTAENAVEIYKFYRHRGYTASIDKDVNKGVDVVSIKVGSQSTLVIRPGDWFIGIDSHQPSILDDVLFHHIYEPEQTESNMYDTLTKIHLNYVKAFAVRVFEENAEDIADTLLGGTVLYNAENKPVVASPNYGTANLGDYIIVLEFPIGSGCYQQSKMIMTPQMFEQSFGGL